MLVAGASTTASNADASMGNRYTFQVSFHGMSAVKLDQIVVSVKEIQTCRLSFFYDYL